MMVYAKQTIDDGLGTKAHPGQSTGELKIMLVYPVISRFFLERDIESSYLPISNLTLLRTVYFISLII